MAVIEVAVHVVAVVTTAASMTTAITVVKDRSLELIGKAPLSFLYLHPPQLGRVEAVIQHLSLIYGLIDFLISTFRRRGFISYNDLDDPRNDAY